MERIGRLEDVMDFGKVRGAILPRLVKAGTDVSDRPHKMMCDLPITYYVRYEAGEETANVLVTNRLMEVWGVSVEELDAIARENQRVEFSTLSGIIESLCGESGMSFLAPGQGDPMGDVKFLSNRDRMFGAAAVLDTGLLDRLEKAFGCEVGIIPSSIHEVLLVPVSMMEAGEMVGIIREVNASTVSPSDLLSDNFYVYGSEAGYRLAYGCTNE